MIRLALAAILIAGLTAALPAIGDAITANTIHPDCSGDSRC